MKEHAIKEDEWFSRLCRDIEDLKIQGAEHIARAAVEGLARYMHEHGKQPPGILVDRLFQTRPTEPMMRNAVRYYLRHATPASSEQVLQQILSRFDNADEKIAEYASGLIKEGGIYFTHCHSSTVTHALIRTHQHGKQFSIHNTETRPRLQGRITAQELAAAGIPVTHYVDSGARIALKDCSAVFIGADALLSDAKVVNKIGSEMVAELAFNRNIPVYVLANSWKFAPLPAAAFKNMLEVRSPEEVWPQSPDGVAVRNDAFELILPRYVTAIITEHGIRDPHGTAAQLQRQLSIDEKTI